MRAEPMNAVALTSPAAPSPARSHPTRKRWTCAEFNRLGEDGWFEGEKLLLIDGELIEMPPPNPPHVTATLLIQKVMECLFGAGHHARVEGSLVLGARTDPVPDVAVVTGSIRDYAAAHPTTALLIVEVAESSFDYDTGEKAGLYAAAGIEDYWVVDLVGRRVLVHRGPQPSAGAHHGAAYSSVQVIAEGGTVEPLATPGRTTPVADLLP
jgi:Uma2 family endonuclease